MRPRIDVAMKKTLFITMLAAALLGGNAYANTGFSGGTMQGNIVVSDAGNLVIFEDSGSLYETLGGVYGDMVTDQQQRFTQATVTIQGGIVANAYGGATRIRGDAVSRHSVWVTGGTVQGSVFGGSADNGDSAWENKVVVTGGKIGNQIVGGVATGINGSACLNKVYVTGLSADCAPTINAGLASTYANNNEVHLVGAGASIHLDGETYQGHAMALNSVSCGMAGDSINNSIDIYGSGIQVESMYCMQSLNFHLVDGLATAEVPMVNLSAILNLESFTLGVIADDVTDWGVLAGRTVTLVETPLAIFGFGDNPYKVVDVSKTGQSASKGILTLGNEGKELRLKVLRPGTEVLAFGEARQAGSTTITALKENEPGLLGNLALGTDIILGAGRDASLADGLDISRMGQDLKLENLVLTANNEIHVGDNTITLKDVTIKISDDVCTLVNGIYTIDLKSLINCDLKMENVLLDASDLTLPQDFDLAKDAVAFDFGDDVTIRQATGLDMRLGNYWSPSLNLDQQGKVIFTKLVETPEPATGTLSLLALAALAARRRRK